MFSLKNKIRVGLAFPVLILAIVGAVSYKSAVRVPETFGWVWHTIDVLTLLREATAEIGILESAQRGYILTGQPKYLEEFRAAEAKLPGLVLSIRNLTLDDPRQQRRLDELQKIVAARLARAEISVELRDRQGLAAAAEAVKEGQGAALSDRFRAVVAEMEAEENKLAAQRRSQAVASSERVILVSGYGFLAALLFAAGASAAIARYVTVPVGRLVEAAEQLGRGELTRRVASESTDELGLLARAFNEMAGRLEMALQQLHRQTSILRCVLTSIDTGVVVADPAGKFLFFNPAAEKILGTGPTEGAPADWAAQYQTYLPDMTTPFPAEELPLARAIRGESVDDVEIFIRHSESAGAWVTFTGRPLIEEDGVLQGGVVVFSDTTERRRAQESLTHERNLLRTLIDHLPGFVFVKDAECRYLLSNASLMRIQGVTRPDEVVGRSDFDFFPAELASLYRAGDEEVLRSGKALINEEEPDPGPSGQSSWISTSKIPLLAPDGRVTGLVGICHDITGRKLTEARIQKLNEDLAVRAAELEIVNKELEAFSYSVSHDLRAPLRHIGGFAELLVKHSGKLLDERGLGFVDIIIRSAQELGQLVDDLLVFSRMGRSEMRTTRVSLDQLVKEAVRDLSPELEGREVTWKIDELPTAQGDPSMLRLVFMNLLSNALKYTRPKARAEIRIGCSNGTHAETVFFVRDNGVGFNMQYVDKLFGVFQRLHRADEFEGTGVGLANVRRIIHRHGGRTWAEGVLNEGATFYCSLPRGEAYS